MHSKDLSSCLLHIGLALTSTQIAKGGLRLSCTRVPCASRRDRARPGARNSCILQDSRAFAPRRMRGARTCRDLDGRGCVTYTLRGYRVLHPTSTPKRLRMHARSIARPHAPAHHARDPKMFLSFSSSRTKVLTLSCESVSVVLASSLDGLRS